MKEKARFLKCYSNCFVSLSNKVSARSVLWKWFAFQYKQQRLSLFVLPTDSFQQIYLRSWCWPKHCNKVQVYINNVGGVMATWWRVATDVWRKSSGAYFPCCLGHFNGSRSPGCLSIAKDKTRALISVQTTRPSMLEVEGLSTTRRLNGRSVFSRAA